MHLFGKGLAALAALWSLSHGVTGSFAQGVTVRSASGKIVAAVVPPRSWCAAVVSVELRGAKDAFQSGPEETQRLIGGMRLRVTEDCPDAEVIRFRGLDKGKTLFVAYTTQDGKWSIEVAWSESDILRVLKLDLARPEKRRQLAYLETLTHMMRANMRRVSYYLENREPSENKLSWVMDEIQGETHMATDRAADPRALKDLADAMLQEQAAACPTAGRQGGEAPGEGAQIRRFECKDGDKTIHHVIVSIDSGRQAAHFVMSSPNRAQLDDFTRVISDRKLLF